MILGSNISQLEQSDIDANTEGVTESLPLDDQRLIGFYVNPESGSHNNHILILQVSGNDIDFYDTPAALTGCGAMPDQWYSANYIRLKIATPEGGASKININIIAK